MRTRLYIWIEQNGGPDVVAGRFGVDVNTVKRWAMPLGMKSRRHPSFRHGEALREMTGGEIHLGNYADMIDPATGEVAA